MSNIKTENSVPSTPTSTSSSSSTSKERSSLGVDNDNEPNYSRLFVVCGKDITEDILSIHFSAFPGMEYCRIVKEKATTESKGVAYIKYDRASSAASAIESLHKKQITDNSPALKVMIAEAKGGNKSKSSTVSKDPSDTPPRSRLFVVCPKDLAEEHIEERFKAFGDYESCRLVKDKTSGESKGFAYVKFSKSSTAARAMEDLNAKANESSEKFKVMIADPKTKRPDLPPVFPLPPPTLVPSPQPYGILTAPSPPPYINTPPTFHGHHNVHPIIPNISNNYHSNEVSITPYVYPNTQSTSHVVPPVQISIPPSRQRLFVVVNKSVTHDQLSKLFSRYPGMEYCDLKKDKVTGESKGFAYINYSTPHAAALAKDQLNGYEFPGSGFTLKVMYAEPLGVTALRDSFAQMLSFPSSTYSPPNSNPTPVITANNASSSENQEDRNYPEGSRLFIVLSKALPEYILQDVFSRFGGLEYVRLQKEKNYGFAKYTTAMAAQYALQYLNGTEVHGQKLKVQIAAPPTDSRKRQRI